MYLAGVSKITEQMPYCILDGVLKICGKKKTALCFENYRTKTTSYLELCFVKLQLHFIKIGKHELHFIV